MAWHKLIRDKCFEIIGGWIVLISVLLIDGGHTMAGKALRAQQVVNYETGGVVFAYYTDLCRFDKCEEDATGRIRDRFCGYWMG